MRSTLALVSALAFALLPSASEAQGWRARVVARDPADGRWVEGPVQARVGESVSLRVVLAGGRGVTLGDVPSLRRGGVTVVPLGPLPQGVAVIWRQVEPLRGHRDHPSPNPGLSSFSNAVLFGPRHGRWLGYDRLEYDTLPLPEGDAARVEGEGLVVTRARPVDAGHDTHGGAGSVWFSAAVRLPDGSEIGSPDGRSVDRLGLSSAVQRVSFREDDGFVGWLGTYFHVASVFGSNGSTAATHQTDRYTGADCADVLIGAMRASGRREMEYVSVASIGRYASPLTGALRVDDQGAVLSLDGSPRPLRWGSDVARGDLVSIDYSDDASNALPRAWDHIGALVEDRGDPGVLDGGDLLRHMGGSGLVDTALRHAGPMRIQVWRWRAPPVGRRGG